MALTYEEVWRTGQVHLTILWTLQISCASVAAIATLLMVIPFCAYQGYYFFGGLSGMPMFAQGLVFLVLFKVIVGLNAHEVTCYREGPLSPNLVFYSGCFKALVALAWFVLTIVEAVLGSLITFTSIIFSVGLVMTGCMLANIGRQYRSAERRGILSPVSGVGSGAAIVREAPQAVEMGQAGAAIESSGVENAEAESERTIVR